MSLINWDELTPIIANWPSAIIALSGDSGAFLLSVATAMQFKPAWGHSDGTDLTDAEWDTIEALCAKAYTQLMSDVGLGNVFPFITSSAPAGSLECDGATYLRTDYPLLYAVLDTAYIVDADHFKVPDLRGRTVIGVGTGSGLSTYAMDASGGVESHALSIAELAQHDHGFTSSPHHHTEEGTTTVSIRVGTGANQNVAVPASHNTGDTTATGGVGFTGSGAAHENRAPYRALRYGVWAI